MKKFKFFYTESKDQSVPFALPALRSYKQNLVFPDFSRKANTSQLPLLDTILPPKPSSNLRSSKYPKSNLSPIRKPSPPRMAPLKPVPKNPVSKKSSTSFDLKKPPARSTEPVRPVSQKKVPVFSEKRKKPEKIQGPKKPIQKPESARVSLRKLPSEPLKWNKSDGMDKKRSHSISSAESIKSVSKSPRIGANLSGLGDIESIPEYPKKKTAGGRSLTRKRPRKGKKERFFNFDPVNFRMSDLSIYPLF